MASTKLTSPTSLQGAAALATTVEERALIREIFATEFGGACTEDVEVRTPELFRALTIRRLGDLDRHDDGSLHSEVLKNTINLLQRFHLCAPVFPRLGVGGGGRKTETNKTTNIDLIIPENMKTNAHALFWRATFCRYFCADLDGLNAGKVWYDVRRFVMALGKIWGNDPEGGREVSGRARLTAAAMYGCWARPARQRGRKNALLWRLMGLASADLREEAWHQNMETWAVEVTARVGLWRRLVSDGGDSILRAPVCDGDGTRAYPEYVLPEYSEGEYSYFECMQSAFLEDDEC